MTSMFTMHNPVTTTKERARESEGLRAKWSVPKSSQVSASSYYQSFYHGCLSNNKKSQK
jgi:hypothetical protein